MHKHFQCIQANGIPTPGCAIWHEEERIGLGPVCPTCEGKLAMPISPDSLPADATVVAGTSAEFYAKTQQTAQAPPTIAPVGESLPELEREPAKTPYPDLPGDDRVDLPEVTPPAIRRKARVVSPPAAEPEPSLNDEPVDEDDYVITGDPPEIPETAPNVDTDADEATTTKDNE